MDIKHYYSNRFAADLASFMPDARLPYFGHTWEHDCGQLDRLPPESRAAFIACLYFTVLVDQAMHAHCRPDYQKFEELTRYPKFCHGLGQFQKNPRAILSVPIERHQVDKDALGAFLDEGMDLFVEETVDFFQEHMPHISPARFFKDLIYDPDVHVPLIFVLASPEMKDDIVIKAQDALWKAVKARFPGQ